MKPTRNIIIFSIINFISSIWFFNALTLMTAVKRGGGTVSVYEFPQPLIYAVIWLITGFVLGATDKTRNVRYDLGLAYHSAMVLTTFIATIVAFILFEEFRNPAFVVVPMFALLTSLAIHWLVRRDTIKGIDKKEAFK